MISPPRAIVTILAAFFSAYHLFLAYNSMQYPAQVAPVIVAMVLYAGATVMSLWPTSPLAMPLWMAALNFAICLVMSILVLSQLDGTAYNGYATWSVAAVGTLLTITAVRQQETIAWIGIAALTVAVDVWGGPVAVTTTGVIGSAVWVGVAHALTRATARAARDARLFGRAERDAAAWHATQEAQLTEGRYRLDQMNRTASPMLHHIIESDGVLSAEDRRECLHLEGAIRDEIRGRHLLNEEVRVEVMAARRRGIDVTLLDEGGLDDLTERDRSRIQSRLADEIANSRADRLIVRTGADGSAAAVTVVGLTVNDDGSSAALGSDTTDDEVAQFTEIPR